MTHLIATTERLELREFSLADAPGFYRLNLDPEVLRYTGDRPFKDEAEAARFIQAYDRYRRDGFGRWSVYVRATGEYIGFCGLNYRPDKDEVDVGFRFMRHTWGQGYATEAAREALALGFSRFALDKIVGRAMQSNVASHRVLQKLGMALAFTYEVEGQPWVQYAITADVFRAQARGMA